MLKIWPGENLDHNLKLIINRQRMVFPCRLSKRKVLLDQIFLRGKIEGTHLILVPKITKQIANSTIKKMPTKQVKEESNTTNSTLIQPKELSK